MCDPAGICPAPAPNMFANRIIPVPSLLAGPTRVSHNQNWLVPKFEVAEFCWMYVSWVPL